MIIMVAEKIKVLREAKPFTQAELARRLGVTRSSVNAWEMGISVPSTQLVVELALLFRVSTDYLLGIEKTQTVDIGDLKEEQVKLLFAVLSYLRSENKENGDV